MHTSAELQEARAIYGAQIVTIFEIPVDRVLSLTLKDFASIIKTFEEDFPNE